MEVDGISVAAAEAIQNASVVSGSIAAGTGHLILETFGGTEIDAGQVAPITNIQVFTADGTWTKPDGAKFVTGFLIAGGGGGGSGARGFPADLGGGAGAGKSGGGGGFPGGLNQFLVNATVLPATMAVDIGPGGTGGAAVTADATQGNPGSNGSNTTLIGGGITLSAIGGMHGAPGGFRDSGGNGYDYYQSKQMNTGIFPSYPGGGRGGRGGILSQEEHPDMLGLHGGGGGGGYDNGSSGPGGGSSPVLSASGAASSANGVDSSINHQGSGGGGGARLVAGGNGGLYGGGGGGGGGSNTGTNSGKGGDGAAGVLVIVTYF